MSWIEEIGDRLARRPVIGYDRQGSPASEPTALSAIALLALGHTGPAREALDWLVRRQAAEGSVGVSADRPRPRWPTGLAVLAWRAACTARAPAVHYRQAARQGVRAILSLSGKGQTQPKYVGHDTTLIGWPWIEGTHSWVEPTALNVLALKANGLGDHARVREAVRLLVDRLLPRGGCNYGNTFMLGRQLRPHAQPTGLSLLALAGERNPDRRIAGAIAYLERTLGPNTTTSSLCWGLLGLAAHGRTLKNADACLVAALRRKSALGASRHQLALLVLASFGDRSPLVTLPKEGSVA